MTLSNSTCRNALLCALTLAATPTLLSTRAQAQIVSIDLNRRVDFDIAAQPLPSALMQFSAQTGLDLSASTDLVEGKEAGSLKGNYSTGEALSVLLRGTGLNFTATDSGVAIIVTSAGEVKNKKASTLEPTASVRLAQAENSQLVEAGEKNSDMNSGVQLEEILVTAQKRIEKLQDVPISISVLSGEDLDRSTASGITEALRTVPGVVPEVAPTGGTTITIRGVAPDGVRFGGSSPTAYYLDAVPFGLVKSAVLPDTNAFDLDRVEVLRGPQGTLYGANALNGVVRVLTHAPDLTEFELKARSSLSSTEHGRRGSSRFDAAVNLPLVDDALAVRAVIGYQDLGGWIDKTAQPLLGIEDHPDVNDSQILTGRFKIRAQFNEQLSLMLSAMTSRTDQGGFSISANNRTNARDDEPLTTDFDTFGATINYEFDNFTLTSATSFLQYKSNDSQNFIGFARLETIFDASVLVEEINLVSTHEGPWRWSLGAMYRDAEDNTYQEFGPLTAAAPINYDQGSKSAALFGEVARSFLDDQFEISVGLRYFEDTVSQNEIDDFELNFVPGGNGLYSNEVTFENISPRVTFTWQPTDNFTAYATYSEGFRSGADQNPNTLVAAPGLPPVEPDTLTNYEIGAKGNLGRGRISYDTALFYIDWQDIQTSFAVPYGDGTQAISAPANADSASGLGFEVSLAAQLTDRLRLGTTFAYNDVTFDTDVVTLGVVRFVKGSRVAGSAEYTAGAFADYSVPIGSSGYEGRFSASANYVSEKIVSAVTSTVSSDDILIGRLSFGVDAPSNWAATLFVDNVTDENGVYEPGVISTDSNSHPRPRTFGLQLEYRWGRR